MRPRIFLFSAVYLAFSSFWTSGFAGNSSPTTIRVVVQGDHVNLRAQSNLNSEVLGQANWGDVLEARRVMERWVELVPPTNVAFWVHADFLHEGVIVKPRTLNVRAGPGENYSIVGQLKRGDPVNVVMETGLWKRITPPVGASLWIARDLVELPKVRPTPTPKPLPTATPRPAPTPIIRLIETIKIVEVEVPVRPEPTPTVVPPKGLELVPLPGQGSRSMRTGYLKSYLLAGTSPSRFQLVHYDQNQRAQTVCYLRVEADALEGFFGKKLKVTGRDFWIRDSILPVMVPEDFEILSMDPQP